MLNAVISCPNIHWFCHECNNGTKSIVASIDSMKGAVDSLTKSLSSDLLSGFKMLTDTLATSLTSIHQSSLSFGADTGNSAKRRRSETDNESESEGDLVTRRKRFNVGTNSNPHGASIAAVNHQSDERRRSIVVSNIDKRISADYLTKYLSSELQVDESNIRITLLKPARITDQQIKFLQFRVSVPENMYNKASAPSTWPAGVRVRDYVFNNRGAKSSVSMENFLSKRSSHTPMEDLTSQSVPRLTTVDVATDLIQIMEEPSTTPAPSINQTMA